MSILIDSALKEMKNISGEKLINEINTILGVLKTKNSEALLNDNKIEVLPEDMKNQINQIKPKLARNDELGECNINFVAKLLKLTEIFAVKSVSNNKFEYIYPISVIFYNLNLEPRFLRQIITEKVFSKMNDIIFELFNRMEDEFVVPESAPYFERESFKKYQNGMRKQNLKDVYFFIESVERGKGIYTNFFVDFLARLLLLEPQKYFSFLESINEPFRLVKYVNIIKNKLNENFLDLLITSNNKWLIFEYLRQIFKGSSYLKFNENEIKMISSLFERIYFINEDFFVDGVLFLARYKNKKYLGIGIGAALSNINQENLVKRILDSMGINERTFNLDLWTFIAKKIKETGNVKLLKFMTQNIFKKWDMFLVDYFESDKIVTKLLLTDYLNLVVYYFQELLLNNKNEFLRLLGEKLDLIIDYKSFWVKYPSRKRFIGLTYIYVMSEAWKRVIDLEFNVKKIANKLNLGS